MEKKFRVLRFIGLLLKIFGVFELIIGIVCLIMLPLTLSEADSAFLQFGFLNARQGTGLLVGVISGGIIFLIGVVCGLLTFSMGELINVFIAIEENSRTQLLYLQKQK